MKGRPPIMLGMGAHFFGDIEPAALRERVREAATQAVAQVFADVIATDSQLAPAAYLQRGLMSLSRGNHDVGVADLRAAVLSHNGAVVYRAASLLLQMHEALVARDFKDAPYKKVATFLRADAVRGLHGGVKSHYTMEIHDWFFYTNRALHFDAHPYAILAWLHSRPGHTLALPALERFYAAAAERGYANPMPQVRQLLLQEPMQTYSSEII